MPYGISNARANRPRRIRKFVLNAFAYAVLGMALGVYMAIAQNFRQMGTHTHIMLVGFVISFAYALCHRLWLSNAGSKFAAVQFYIHQAATIVLLAGLFLLYGGFVPAERVGPVLGTGSIFVFVGMLLMFVMLLRSPARS